LLISFNVFPSAKKYCCLVDPPPIAKNIMTHTMTTIIPIITPNITFEIPDFFSLLPTSESTIFYTHLLFILVTIYTTHFLCGQLDLCIFSYSILHCKRHHN